VRNGGRRAITNPTKKKVITRDCMEERRKYQKWYRGYIFCHSFYDWVL
jgi:hypothetical protein